VILVVSVRAQLLTVCLFGLGLAACEVTPEERAETACRVICECEAGPLPALQDACVADCRREIDTSRISDECLACVSANTDRCQQIQQLCEPICDPGQPEPTDGGPGGGSGI